MLVAGKGIGQPVECYLRGRRASQCKYVFSRTTLQLAMLSDESWGKPIPRWGGVYVPDVMVFKDDEGNAIAPFRVAMLYATSPWATNLDEDPELMQFRAELREKISNVLRICHERGHTELILCAWSCGHAGPPKVVANIFHELLLRNADTARVFERVVFAIPSHIAPTALDDFRLVFERDPSA